MQSSLADEVFENDPSLKNYSPDISAAPTDDESPIIPFPTMHPDAFQGIIKRIVETAAINCEASAVAIGMTFIEYFSALVGRRIFMPVSDYDLHCRPYSLLIGKSSKARKGTSGYLVDKIFTFNLWTIFSDFLC